MMPMTVSEALDRAGRRLTGRDARFEALYLLGWLLGKNRAWLYAYPEYVLENRQQELFEEALARLQVGEPLAYITGTREFWSLELQVSPAVLIPRADTETLVQAALGLFPTADHIRVADLGTGSGAIACAIASERPLWDILATDASAEALAVAERNIGKLALQNVRLQQSDWFEAIEAIPFDLIVSNPPYIDARDPHLLNPGLQREPQGALVSGNEGLQDLAILIDQSPGYLKTDGWLLLEHGYDQGAPVRSLLEQRGFRQVSSVHDLAGQERVSLGQWGDSIDG